MLLGFGAITEVGQDLTSVGVHMLLGGLTQVTQMHSLIKIIYLLTQETASCSLTAGHNNNNPIHHGKTLNYVRHVKWNAFILSENTVKPGASHSQHNNRVSLSP